MQARLLTGFYDTGDWQLMHRIEDEAAALERLGIALTDTAYAALGK